MQNILILVDVQNVYYTTRQTFAKNFNYNKFWAQVTHERHVVKAIAYAVDRGDKKQQEFQNILRAIGFDVKLKPFIQRSDGSAKGDWDVGITIDALEYCAQADVVVLVSGDGDFAILAEHLRHKRNKQVEVYGVAHLTAAALCHAADRYIPIDKELLLN
ncbi:NYN domain-containing protein [Celerinatantimonas sp. MCCC 1A17872]|uniref:LabA-like NYN domain-containing protein n=1 Tax=Celerinatantimonas sp. MCCC 1A17872 TaxID=3177514 RepID=UPI0038C4CA58